MHNPSHYLELVTSLIRRFEIDTVSFSGHEIPLETAMDAQGLSPLFVLEIASIVDSTGMFRGASFPFTALAKDDNPACLLGHQVIAQDSPVPLSVALLASHFRVERLVQSSQDLKLGSGVMSFDPIAATLEDGFGKPLVQSPSMSMF